MKDEVMQSMKAAMKAGDKLRVSVLRMVLSEIKNAELAGLEIKDAVVGYARKLEKSIEEYRRLGKPEEASRFEAEHKIVGEFLPRKLTDEEIAAVVDKVAAEEHLASMKDFGRGMKAAMAALGAQADGKKVQELLKKKLGG